LQKLRALLAERGLQDVSTSGLIVFTNPKAQLRIEAPSVTVTRIKELKDVLRRMAGKGTSVALTTSRIREIQRMFDERMRAAHTASVGGRIVEELKPLAVYRVGFPAQTADAALASLRANQGVVKGAEPDGEQTAQIVPNDPLYRQFQWNLRRIRMEQTWDLRPDAADVTVAVLDTGVDLTHPDLKPNLLSDQGYDFLD